MADVLTLCFAFALCLQGILVLSGTSVEMHAACVFVRWPVLFCACSGHVTHSGSNCMVIDGVLLCAFDSYKHGCSVDGINLIPAQQAIPNRIEPSSATDTDGFLQLQRSNDTQAELSAFVRQTYPEHE